MSRIGTALARLGLSPFGPPGPGAPGAATPPRTPDPDPAADPGPAATAALVARVRRLELAARANVAGLHAGAYPTAIRGSGLVYEEPRRYQPGDPVRHIDWNATARLDQPIVKRFREERRREVILALDVSPSMHAGFRRKTKLECAVELAATLAVTAADAGDRVGHVLFADRVLAEARPRAGRHHLHRVLAALLAHTRPWERTVAESDPRSAVHAVERRRGRGFVVFLISDFIDHDVPDDLAYLRPRHDVSLLHVYDPVEYAAGRDVVLPAAPPEPGGPAVPLRPGPAGGLEELRADLGRAAARHRIALGSFSTAEPVGRALGAFLHHRRALLARAR